MIKSVTPVSPPSVICCSSRPPRAAASASASRRPSLKSAGSFSLFFLATRLSPTRSFAPSHRSPLDTRHSPSSSRDSSFGERLSILGVERMNSTDGAEKVPNDDIASGDVSAGAVVVSPRRPFRIRTVTAFVALSPIDFEDKKQGDGLGGGGVECRDSLLEHKIRRCSDVIRTAERRLVAEGYEVQTVRIATNPFGEWLTATAASIADAKLEKVRGDNAEGNDAPPPSKKPKSEESCDQNIETARERLEKLDALLSLHDIGFCSLGPSMRADDTEQICPLIVSRPGGRFACSANVEANDIAAAKASARCMQTIASLRGDDDPSLAGGLGSFRFGTASRLRSGVPFFPGARGPSFSDREEPTIGFALGLENGGFAKALLAEAGGIERIGSVFADRMREELIPLQRICTDVAAEFGSADDKNANRCEEGEPKLIPPLNPSAVLLPSVQYVGIDTSLNPSLDDGGSVASAIEALSEVGETFGGRGSLAAAAAITKSLQSVPDIKLTGYCGLMLPVLEDRRLAELAARTPPRLTLVHLLSISSVCGVGVDTVPVPGDATEEELASIILDVAALAGRWNKPLSCRLFPAPRLKARDETEFDSPYMCNSRVFDVE